MNSDKGDPVAEGTTSKPVIEDGDVSVVTRVCNQSKLSISTSNCAGLGEVRCGDNCATAKVGVTAESTADNQGVRDGSASYAKLIDKSIFDSDAIGNHDGVRAIIDLRGEGATNFGTSGGDLTARKGVFNEKSVTALATANNCVSGYAIDYKGVVANTGLKVVTGNGRVYDANVIATAKNYAPLVFGTCSIGCKDCGDGQ